MLLLLAEEGSHLLRRRLCAAVAAFCADPCISMHESLIVVARCPRHCGLGSPLDLLPQRRREREKLRFAKHHTTAQAFKKLSFVALAFSALDDNALVRRGTADGALETHRRYTVRLYSPSTSSCTQPWTRSRCAHPAAGWISPPDAGRDAEPGRSFLV